MKSNPVDEAKGAECFIVASSFDWLLMGDASAGETLLH